MYVWRPEASLGYQSSEAIGDGLNTNGPLRPIESCTIRMWGPVGVGVALLEEVCYWRGGGR